MAKKVENMWKGEAEKEISAIQFLALVVEMGLTERQVLTMMRFFKERGHYVLPSYPDYRRAKKLFHPVQNSHSLINHRGEIIFNWSKPDMSLPMSQLEQLMSPQYFSEILPFHPGIPRPEIEGAQFPINHIVASMITEQIEPVKKAIERLDVKETTFFPATGTFKLGGDGHGNVKQTRMASKMDVGDHGLGLNITLMKLSFKPLGTDF